MSVMDKLRQMLKGHEEKTPQDVDRAGDTADETTRGKYQEQIDTAQQKAKDRLQRDPEAPRREQDNPPQD
ncbi:antitoxin [Streptomyces sp. MUM 178J]|uniref:antitoxin n=1 Tax=Streptomyces sp. MUM 178J TaxID=2791991 RepID=UPI001F041259|nr:antitoxin [Streptomyces sp. MUM 178J]WRQ79142.1 antitoxin [Streptomyces sp. MUM 178J]